jgi:hypothetical protein
MRLRLSMAVVLLTLFLVANPCFAQTDGEQRTIEMLVRGGPESQRDAAQNLHNGGAQNTEVLDVAAEVLLQSYRRPGFVEVDATAWLCKALGASGNDRYRGVLTEVASNSAERKVKKHASQALEMLRQSGSTPYRAGTVDLVKLRNGTIKSPERPAKGTKTNRTSSETTGGASFDRITHGMSMEEVYDLLGQPTATTSRITGKAWAPFYHGGDTARMFALYKNKGRIIFSNTSRYAPVWRVIEVVPDSSESGYP